MTMVLLTEDHLALIFRRPAERLRAYLEPLVRTAAAAGIDTEVRLAAYLAQLGHESGGLRYWEEIWGPTPAQLRYEPPSALAARLGNTQAGDGYRYRGRGPIQLTGRQNYRKVGLVLGLSLEDHPEQVATPEVGLRVAAHYWQTHGCNELADAGDFRGLTKRINGGYNGLEDRFRRWTRACEILGLPAPEPV